MPSKHKEAHDFIRSGFFEGLNSFSDFESRTERLANSKQVGDAFEIFVEGYLHVSAVLGAKEVWLVGDVPLSIRTRLNLPADSKGIDGVYQDAAGNLIPYQAKYRTDKNTLSYTEVSSFLGVTEESLLDRVIFTNARGLADDISNRKGLRSVCASQFHALTEQDFIRIQAWLCNLKPDLRHLEPLPHQCDAVEKIVSEFKHASRTTAVMACGTGKTLVALWVAEALNPRTVLVLVPSLALLSQALPEWCRQSRWGDLFRYLCVCSDSSVDRSAQDDEYALKQSDVEFRVTTDAKRVEEFLAANRSGVNVIFSTYQSAAIVAEGLNGAPIDFGVFDEAHKTTGLKEGLFAFALSDENIFIRKRLFLTATPRHYDLLKRDKDGNFRIVSMNDEQVYGKVAYRLTFAAAVTAGVIVPYKVIISVSLKREVDDELLQTGVTFVRSNQIQAKWVANQIALKRAIEKTSAAKVITFHSRVKLAEEFASDGAQGFSEHVKEFEIFHVNGAQTAASRKALLESFRRSSKGLISNARCLTEGIDVPCVDMVAFIEPRKSRIDIAQAAGRVMRQSKATNKKQGYIVVPLFIQQEGDETESQALARTGFEEVALVLGAMLENDDDLIDVIRELQEGKGRGEHFDPKKLHERIEVIGPRIDLEELKQSIDVEIVNRLGTGWDLWLGLLQKFHAREGHCLPDREHQENGLNLGTWVQSQRSKKSTLLPDQIERLDQLGFSWDLRAETWEANFKALCKFKEREGHCCPEAKHIESGLNLGGWAGYQRSKKSTLLPDQIERLDQLGFSWDPRAEFWESNFEALCKFKEREGHCCPNSKHTENGLRLGTWVVRQRSIKGTLLPDQIQRLDQLGFSWEKFDFQNNWEASFEALQKFHAREGHCLPDREHQENGLNLGTWVQSQRSKKSTLLPDQIERLDQLGFSWDLRAETWEANFKALCKFKEREGHCCPEAKHIESGLNLGGWAGYQRSKKSTLLPDQIERLDQLGFSWDPRAEFWESNFEALCKFKEREGHCCPNSKHTENGLRLGTWVVRQRSIKGTLLPDQIQRLDQLGFSWKV